LGERFSDRALDLDDTVLLGHILRQSMLATDPAEVGNGHTKSAHGAHARRERTRDRRSIIREVCRAPKSRRATILPTDFPAGGYDLHIQGAGFINVTSVLLGDTPATNIRVLSSNELVVTVPAHAAGVVNVKAFTTLGHSVGTEYDDFTYTSG
jgi:hypothetical protein